MVTTAAEWRRKIDEARDRSVTRIVRELRVCVKIRQRYKRFSGIKIKKILN